MWSRSIVHHDVDNSPDIDAVGYNRSWLRVPQLPRVYFMGELVDRLDALVVEATSLDRQITAAVGGGGHRIAVAFRTGAYRRYTEAALGNQLAQLATRIFVRYKREFDKTVELFYPNVSRDESTEYRPETQQYQERLMQIVVSAKSPDAISISLETHALLHTTVVIAPGTLRRLSEEEFLAALLATVNLLLALYRSAVNKLKDDVFGLGIPGYVPRSLVAYQANGLKGRG